MYLSCQSFAVAICIFLKVWHTHTLDLQSICANDSRPIWPKDIAEDFKKWCGKEGIEGLVIRERQTENEF